jgi:hypothetical protein
MLRRRQNQMETIVIVLFYKKIKARTQGHSSYGQAYLQTAYDREGGRVSGGTISSKSSTGYGILGMYPNYFTR